jgi:hypothetical protein
VVAARMVKGTRSTGRYIPEAFAYNLKVPTLQGVSAKSKRAFDRRIDSLIAAELAFYAKAALTQEEFNASVESPEAAGMSTDKWVEWCHVNFKDLTGTFSSSVYRGRYASVVLTFSGLNAPCVGLGGLWVAYQTDRSVTIDAKTANLKSLADFTSNANGEVTAAVKTWYARESPKSLSKRPKVTKDLKVCDRPGNVATILPQESCYIDPYVKSGLVAWLVQDKGIRLTFPAADGRRYTTIRWARLPRLL